MYRNLTTAMNVNIIYYKRNPSTAKTTKMNVGKEDWEAEEARWMGKGRQFKKKQVVHIPQDEWKLQDCNPNLIKIKKKRSPLFPPWIAGLWLPAAYVPMVSSWSLEPHGTSRSCLLWTKRLVMNMTVFCPSRYDSFNVTPKKKTLSLLFAQHSFCLLLQKECGIPLFALEILLYYMRSGEPWLSPLLTEVNKPGPGPWAQKYPYVLHYQAATMRANSIQTHCTRSFPCHVTDLKGKYDYCLHFTAKEREAQRG